MPTPMGRTKLGFCVTEADLLSGELRASSFQLRDWEINSVLIR